MGYVPSRLFDLRPNYGGGNEDNSDLLQKVGQCPRPFGRTPPSHASAWDSWTRTGKSGSVSCGASAGFLLGSGAHKVLFVLSQHLFPQSWVSSSSSVVGFMEPSSKKAYPYSDLLHPEPLPLRQATADLCLHRRHSHTQAGLAQSLRGSQGFVWALRASMVGMAFDSKHNFMSLTILLGLLLCPWTWGIFSRWDPTFSCWWLFTNELWFWSSCRRRWAHVLLMKYFHP